MNFWGEWAEEIRKERELPPLTDEMVSAFEKRTGLKLPKALVDLLRTKNGGCVQNSDFKFKGKDYCVTAIEGVGLVEDFSSIRSYAFILDGSDTNEMRELLQKKLGNLSKLLYVADSGGYPYAFALNYNHLNSAAEPTVYCVYLEGDEADANFTADSFGEFLKGQYFGDAKPIVDLAEAGKYRLVAEGGYDGTYTIDGQAVQMSWKICSHRNRLIVFQQENWAGKKEFTRSELYKAALCFAFKSLESYGVKLEPDFAELIRPAVEPEILSVYDAPITPKCYELLLHIQPGQKEWVAVDASEPYEDRWKNSSYNVVYASVKSANKSELERTFEAVAKSCVGLRRFFS